MAARARRAERIDAQVLRFDFDVDVVGLGSTATVAAEV